MGPPPIAAPWVGRQWSYRQPWPRATREEGEPHVQYATAIGLDVHARSIKAFALNPMTGEFERASFGYDPASVAEWALDWLH